MNISYDLWPIWADYLEEQGQDTELLRYYLEYGNFVSCNRYIGTYSLWFPILHEEIITKCGYEIITKCGYGNGSSARAMGCGDEEDTFTYVHPIFTLTGNGLYFIEMRGINVDLASRRA